MTKVLLTGSSGFIGAHILLQLLAQGHTIFTTVRTEDQASWLRSTHAEHASRGRLHVHIVRDFLQPHAFDAAVSQIEASEEGGLEVVIHTASPTHFKWKDTRSELVDPAVHGTTSMLSAIHKFARLVRRVVVTSSVYAIADQSRLLDPEYTFSEQDWNPDTLADLDGGNPMVDYGIAKVFAERAAWSFIAEQNPSFDLVTVCTPTVFGPVAHHVPSLDAINASNYWVAPLFTRQWKSQIPPGEVLNLWIDVRDCAEAHVQAMSLPLLEKPLRRRLLFAGGRFSHRDIARIVRDNFPEYAERLPGSEVEEGEMPAEDRVFKYNHDETARVLNIVWRSLDRAIIDTVHSVRRYIV